MKQKIRLILEDLVESPYRNNAYDYALEQIRSLIRAEKKERLRDGNVLPNIGNFPIDIYNSALDRVLEIMK